MKKLIRWSNRGEISSWAKLQRSYGNIYRYRSRHRRALSILQRHGSRFTLFVLVFNPTRGKAALIDYRVTTRSQGKQWQRQSRCGRQCTIYRRLHWSRAATAQRTAPLCLLAVRAAWGIWHRQVCVKGWEEGWDLAEGKVGFGSFWERGEARTGCSE